MASKQASSRQSNQGAREGDMNPQGQRPEDMGEDLPDPTRKPSESDKDRGKKDTGKNDTAKHKPGRM